MNLYRQWNRLHSRRETERLLARVDELHNGTAKVISLDDWQAHREDAKRRRAAWPAPRRAAWRGGQWVRYRLFGKFGILRHTLNPRRLMNQAVWFWQRGRRGWADCDAWSLDSYIAGVLSPAMRYLADTTQVWPGEGSRWATFEDWTAYLRDLADQLGAWNSETWADTEAFETTRAAMKEVGEEFGFFWD